VAGCSSQEEADTRLILHSLDSVRKCPTELYIESVTGVRNEKREISLGLVVQALGITRTAVLPGFMYEVVEKPCCQFFSKGYCTFSEHFRIDPQRA